jgi:uncharacterized protein YdeI (YjbR/CyaY-like superfamily)
MAEQLGFSDRAEFREWLQKNHSTNKGIWIVFTKTALTKKLTPNEALEEALCFGWIDGQIKSLDNEKYLKKFTARTKDSRWSDANKALAVRLVECGRMTEQGQAAIERAKSRGTRDVHRTIAVSDEQTNILIDVLQGADLALSNFLKMPPSVRRTYTAFYLDAKAEQTRKRRLERIIDRLNANKRPM